ncbi:MAG TPA: hypothetical protein VER32_10010 [Pyrinomonadaceae bacterium]|nr:hypothetical protein [Pyrinomonadaceae bacterium]
MRRTWKRLVLSVLLALFVMGADTVLLAELNRRYRPAHPPAWAVNTLYYFVAWPLAVTRPVFPRAEGDADEGPSFWAVASAGVISLLLLTLVIYALLTLLARRKGRAARA